MNKAAGWAILVVSFAMTGTAWGWGVEGHQLVAWIAEERLTDAAKLQVKELLGDGVDLSDGEVAGWADEVRRQRRESAPWHYINIPVDAKGYDAKRDSRSGGTVLTAIDKFQKVLADKAAPREERTEALKYLVHFVGDVHQPLHAADRHGDKGGNGRLVFFPGTSKAVSLHSVWDGLILRASKGRQSVADYGGTLNKRITKKQADEWAKSKPEQWAVESWTIAREVVYAGIPADGPPPKISEEYIATAKPVVDEQLEKAGVRLASVLNLILK